jgi:hypothetical protein
VVSIPNELTAFVIGFNGERLRRMHQTSGAYLFVPKDYNTLTNERLIQISGNEQAADFCTLEIQYIVAQVAPLLNIDLAEFKKTVAAVKQNFREII